MRLYSTLSDAELLVLLKSGDHAAFKEIFDRYNTLLVNFAAKRSNGIEEAEDVVQEIFLHIWNHSKEFAVEGSLRNYLHRAVVNRLLNLLKHQNVQEAYIQSFQNYLDDGVNETDFRVRERVIHEIIEKEINALPPKMRQVFQLRNYKYMSNKEIAQNLGISEQTVETHIKKALKILRTKLGLAVYLLHIFY